MPTRAHTALRAVAVTARVVLPLAVTTGVAVQPLATQRGGATGNDTPPGFGLGGVQCVGCQIRWAKLAQCIGHGASHGNALVGGVRLEVVQPR
jgi:hypothetical protein